MTGGPDLEHLSPCGIRVVGVILVDLRFLLENIILKGYSFYSYDYRYPPEQSTQMLLL